ncbi:uncharacterized protein [Narcine bancroftii]|uniref:uncharacterized protein isoform X2 n=1 Tax=Narcine bancroftii TaxID=1343680 RepID=UPI003831CC0A
MEGEQPLHWPPVPFTTPDCYITEGSSPPPTPGLGGQGRTGFWSWPMTETRGLRMDKRMDLLLINALLLGLSTLFCQAFATSMVRAIFLPMKCGEEPTSGSCVDGRETVEESKCLSSGCCYRNTTCYRKVSDSRRLILHYFLLIFLILLITGALLGCVFYNRQKARQRKKAQKEATAKRKMDKIYKRQFHEYNKRRG